MAGFFQNRTNLQEDRGTPASDAYETTNTNTTINTNTAASVATEATIDTTPNTPLTIQPIPQGFGAYLDGILPPDNAKAAGAFSVAMQQIKNISSIPIEKFAQVVNSLETTKGLNVNGTSVPTDTTLASQGLALIALGNGPFGTYTMSNFLGCMSGLPYLGINIRQLIQQLETSTLYNIYKNLYLAVTWELAVLTPIATETSPGSGTWTLNGFTITNPGGGYRRDGALAPNLTLNNGASALALIGTDPTNISTYGQIIGYTITNAGSSLSNNFTCSVAIPPDNGTGGWPDPDMNGVVQDYIDAANAEIQVIKNNDPARAQQLITNWEKTGTLLSFEQRAIATGMSLKVPLATPVTDREPTLAAYPSTQYSFVDSIPRYAKFTQPHMYSQTLEAISDLNTLGGRSIVGMLRESRNQARLQEAGIPLDNNIDNKLTTPQQNELIANGVLANSLPATNGITPLNNGTYTSTSPASLQTELGSPDPYGYYDPTTDNYYNTNSNYQGIGPIIGQEIGQGNGQGIGQVIDTGQAIEPGSFAGSRYRNLIPPELSAIYTSDVLLPSTYSIQDAIDEVIRCNCDCWDNI